jgi:hypothetical protein
MSSAESFSPFGDTFLIAVMQNITEQLKEEVDRADLTYGASVNPAEYAASLAAQFAISPLAVDVDQATMTPREETVRAERFDIYSGRQAGDLYTRQLVTVHVPFTGDPAVFRYQANTRTICPRPIWLTGDEVCFDVIVPTHASADLKGEVKRVLTCLSENTRCLDQEIARFNQSLSGLAKGLVDRRRAELQQRLGILETLDLPLKKADAVAATVSVPAMRKRSRTPRPERTTDMATHSFLVAFSFPGETRRRIGRIASILEERLGHGSVFYDEWYKAELARPNLDLHLQDVYTRAELVVVCLCAGYERKEWCGLEWRAIRDLIKRRQDKIMLLRLDDAPVAGSFSIDGYLDLRTHNDDDVGALIYQRVTGKRQDVPPAPANIPKRPSLEASVVGNADATWNGVAQDLTIEINEIPHGFAAGLRNDGLQPVEDCRILLERLDRYLPQKCDFTKNPFEPMTVLCARQIAGGEPSHGFAFATWDANYRSISFHADIPEHRKSLRPELTTDDIWIAEFTLYHHTTILSQRAAFIKLTPGRQPALIPDPRHNTPTETTSHSVRLAHLKDGRVRLTPVLPITRAQDEYFVRNVTNDAVELGKSSGHIITIPARRITDDLPVSDDTQGLRLLELDGRLQWISLSRSWRFFPEKPGSTEERQYGFSRATLPEDPIIRQLQERGQNTRFARLENLPRYLHKGYQLVYDEAGLFLKHGDLILIASGV